MSHRNNLEEMLASMKEQELKPAQIIRILNKYIEVHNVIFAEVVVLEDETITLVFTGA